MRNEVAIELFALTFNRGNCYSAKEMSTWTAIFMTALPLPLSLVGGSYRMYSVDHFDIIIFVFSKRLYYLEFSIFALTFWKIIVLL